MVPAQSATAKVARASGIMFQTPQEESDSDGDYAPAKLLSVQVVQDALQSPLGEQSAPMMLEALVDASEDEEESQELLVSTLPIKEEQLPLAVDTMKGIKDVDGVDVIQPENINVTSSQRFPSKKCCIVIPRNREFEGAPYTGNEGYKMVLDYLPALVEEGDGDPYKKPWHQDGPKVDRVFK